jgi:DNA-binding MarR family transcriptional regulator
MVDVPRQPAAGTPPAVAPEDALDRLLAELEERHLPSHDARVLLWLAERDSSPDELVAALGDEPAATHQALRRLERRGLVRRRYARDPRDPSLVGATVAGLATLRPLVGRVAGTGQADRYSLWKGRDR